MGARCQADEHCQEGALCDAGRCVPARRPINLLYLYYRSGDRRFTEILGIYWHRKGRRGFRVLFPFYWHFWSEQDRARVFFPLYWQFDDHGAKTTNVVVPPFQYRRTPDERNYRLWPLLFITDYRERGSGVGLFPLFYFARRGDRSTAIVFPVVWHFASGDRSFTLAGPVFHRRRGPTVHAGLFPLLLYRSQDRGKRASIISPLFLYERDDDARVKQWATVVPPYYRRRDAQHEIDTLFPLLWRWHNLGEQTTTWTLPPLFLSYDPGGRTLVAFPIFWRFSDTGSGNATSVLFPLFYRHRRGDGTSFNLLFPLYYRNRRPGWSAGVFPLLFSGAGAGSRHFVLFPAIWHIKSPEASTTVVGPAYYRRDKGRGWLAGLAPLFFAGDRDGDAHHVVFPLLWHLRSRREGFDTWIAGPFVWSNSRSGRLRALLPLLATGHWKGRDFTAVLPPLFWRSRNPDTNEGFTLAGLYYGFRQGQRSGFSLFPLLHHRSSVDRQGRVSSATTLFPLFYHRRAAGKRLLVTPVGGLQRDDTRGLNRGVIGPVVWNRTRKISGFAVLPLLFHWRRPAERSRSTVLVPIGVHHRSPDLDADVVFPVFWRLRDRQRKTLVLFPVYWRVRNPAGENADVVFPAVWRLWNSKRRTQIFGPFFTRRTPKTRSWGLVPLALYRRNERRSYFAALPLLYYRHEFKQQKRTWIVGPGYFRRYRRGYAAGLFPLVFHKRTPEKRYTIVAPIVWHFANPPAKTSTTFVGPFFHRKKDDHRALGIAPVLYFGWGPSERSTAVLPLFYHHRGINSWSLYTPLFGFARSTERKLWYLPPYLHTRSRTSSLTTLFPLFLHHRNHRRQRTTLFVLPTYYGSWSAERSLHLFFPLVWRSRRVDSSATVIFPLYWDFHNRYQSRTTMVFPLFMRHRNWPARSTSYLFPPGIWYRSRADASDAVIFPLFWHFGGQRRSTTVGFPLYWRFKRGKRTTTVFFPLYWDFDRADRRTMVVLNTYYRRDKRHGTYQFHFIPLFSIQRKRPRDIKWEVLTGLFGYERIGRNRFLTLLFFFNVELDPTPVKPLQQQQAAVWH